MSDQKDALTALGMNSVAGDNSEDFSPVDMDSLLNQSLDDIPDLPDFVNPREGAYRLHVDTVDLAKEIGDTKAIQINYTVKELIEEKGTTTGDVVKPGDKFSELYFMSTAKGAAWTAGALKKLLQPVAERSGCVDLRATLVAFAGCDVAAMIKHQKDREDKSKVYAKVSKIIFEN